MHYLAVTKTIDGKSCAQGVQLFIVNKTPCLPVIDTETYFICLVPWNLALAI